MRALRKKEIFANREKNYPQVSFGKKEKDGLLLDVDVESKTAVLTIKDFHADILKKYYKQRFKKTITGYFARIKESGVQHLILDVRNNQGGARNIPNCCCRTCSTARSNSWRVSTKWINPQQAMLPAG